MLDVEAIVGEYMKIREIISEDLVSLNLLSKFFKTEESLKATIAQTLNYLLDVYRKKAPKRYGQVDFSNEIADNIRRLTLETIAKKYQITGSEELQELD